MATSQTPTPMPATNSSTVSSAGSWTKPMPAQAAQASGADARTTAALPNRCASPPVHGIASTEPMPIASRASPSRPVDASTCTLMLGTRASACATLKPASTNTRWMPRTLCCTAQPSQSGPVASGAGRGGERG